ncbi:MAG: calcium-binding protein [Victivallaceae bacterium]|nr:calcium-binding protein [Victivallaceae bacterium]
MADCCDPGLLQSGLYFYSDNGDGTLKVKLQWSDRLITCGEESNPSFFSDEEQCIWNAYAEAYRNARNLSRNSAASYAVTIKDLATGETVEELTGIDTTSVQVDLATGGEYLWQVSALDANGASLAATSYSYLNSSLPEYPTLSVLYNDSSEFLTIAQKGMLWTEDNAVYSRVSVEFTITDTRTDTSQDFFVCGKKPSGQEWQAYCDFAQANNFAISQAFGFGDAEEEFSCSENTLLTLDGLYALENGQWNFVATIPPVPYNGQIARSGDFFLVTGKTSVSGRNIYRYENGEINLYRKAPKQVYFLSGTAYLMDDGVYALTDSRKLLSVKLSLTGDLYLYNDLLIQGGIKKNGTFSASRTMLERNEIGTFAVKVWEFGIDGASATAQTLDLFTVRTAGAEYELDDISRVGDFLRFEVECTTTREENYLFFSRGADNQWVKVLASTKDYTLNSDGDLEYSSFEGGQMVTDTVSPLRRDSFSLGARDSGIDWAEGGTAVEMRLRAGDSAHALRLALEGHQRVSFYNLPLGDYDCTLKNAAQTESDTKYFIAVPSQDAPAVYSAEEGNATTLNLFFARSSEVWSSFLVARNMGTLSTWSGTGEAVEIAGKNRISDLFFGNLDNGILCLTDSDNGDALFLDDIYTALPDSLGQSQSRIARISEIRMGAGNDLVDMTSPRFVFVGEGQIIRGGDGDDTIWANSGTNALFGDAGNDRLVGADGDDLFVGGSGNDSMHGGGGKDLFTFSSAWGEDTIEQLAGGSVTLWFEHEVALLFEHVGVDTKITSSEGTILAKDMTLSLENCRFGFSGLEEQYNRLAALGAFASSSTEKIFEDREMGVLACR